MAIRKRTGALVAVGILVGGCAGGTAPKSPEAATQAQGGEGVATADAEAEPAVDALVEVASFGDSLATSMAVSKSGRKFVNFPRWSKEHTGPSVAEVSEDGSLVPFPSQEWNSWQDGEDPGSKFVCVQSVYVDAADRLWILDPGAPFFGAALPGGPKLVQVDLQTNDVAKVIHFDEKVAPPSSYLNDVRLDEEGSHAFITDSNLGHLVVVDLEQETSRVVLDSHASMKAEQGVVPTVEGVELRLPDGNVFAVNSDGIAVADGYVYYHAVTGNTLYRVPTALLRDPKQQEQQLAKAVEKVAETGVHDGMEADAGGNLYLTQLEENAIKVLRKDGTQELLVQDERIQWPDSVAIGEDGYLYVTVSQVHLLPIFNKGEDRRKNPYRVFKVKLPQ